MLRRERAYVMKTRTEKMTTGETNVLHGDKAHLPRTSVFIEF